MLTVHHLNNSRSQRVLWLLEELDVAYDIVRYQRQPDMRAPAELRAIHPLGKSPVITDNGNTIAESGAITEYVLDTYGNGRLIPPPKTPERLRYTYWLHYAEGSAMPPLLLKLLFTLMPKRAPALLRPLVRKVSNQALTTLVNPQLKQHMAFWESELEEPLVRRQRVHRCRYPDELSAGGRSRPRRIGAGTSQSDRFSRTHSCSPRLSARIGKRRTLYRRTLRSVAS